MQIYEALTAQKQAVTRRRYGLTYNGQHKYKFLLLSE